MSSPDIIVHDEGSIFLLRPVSPAGHAWVDENVAVVQRIGGVPVVEHRFIAVIVQSAIVDGLEVEEG